MTKTYEQLFGKVDASTSTTTHAALMWGVGQPYVSQWMLDEPPVAPTNLLFLPAAIAHVGRATDPDWGGWERTTLHYPPFPVQPKLELDKLISLDQRLAPKKSALLPPSLTSRPTVDRASNYRAALDAHEEAMEAWAADAPNRLAKHNANIEAEKKCFRQWAEGVDRHLEGVQALARAFNTLTRAVLDGGVPISFRSVDGGLFRILEPTVLTRSGLAAGAIRNGIYDSGQGRFYLFADRAALEQAFPTSGGGSISVDGKVVALDQLSPYIQLAIRVALAEGVDPDYRVKKDVLRDEISKAMSSFGLTDEHLGNTARGYLATLIRWPDARKGRAE